MTYGPGLYAVRLDPGDDWFSKSLALARRFGDYEPAERAWYIRVILPGQNAAGALTVLAGLGASITREEETS